jgi:hypothetical protein
MNSVCRLLLLKNSMSTSQRPVTFAEGAGIAVDRGLRFADSTA